MAILCVTGVTQKGQGDFTRRMKKYCGIFEAAVGQTLFTGTLNVRIAHPLKVQEHFRIRGADIGEPEQDLIFEVCRINGIWGYRIRPFQPATGAGGHGDHILEITSNQKIPDADHGRTISIEFFR